MFPGLVSNLLLTSVLLTPLSRDWSSTLEMTTPCSSTPTKSPRYSRPITGRLRQGISPLYFSMLILRCCSWLRIYFHRTFGSPFQTRNRWGWLFKPGPSVGGGSETESPGLGSEGDAFPRISVQISESRENVPTCLPAAECLRRVSTYPQAAFKMWKSHGMLDCRVLQSSPAALPRTRSLLS